MNRIDKVREKVNSIILDKIGRNQRCEAASHLFGVSQFCALLAYKRGCNAELASIAGMLHDIYTYSEGSSHNHAHKGAALAYNILDALGLFTELEMSLVCTAIYNHSDKAHTHDTLSEILKDADVLQHVFYNVTGERIPKEETRFDKLCAELGLNTH